MAKTRKIKPKISRGRPLVQKLKGGNPFGKIRFEIWGEEVIQKRVKVSATSGRVYLPTRWVGSKVKIVRID